MYWQIGIFAASIAMVAFIVFLIPVVLESRQAMRESVIALRLMQARVEHTAEEARQVAQLSQHLLQDLQNRIHSTDALFEAMAQTGEAAGRFSQSVKQVSRTLTDTVLEAAGSLHNRQDTVRDIIELGAAGVQLWQKWQAHKHSKTAAQANEQS